MQPCNPDCWKLLETVGIIPVAEVKKKGCAIEQTAHSQGKASAFLVHPVSDQDCPLSTRVYRSMSDEIAAASLWGRVKAEFQNLPGEHPTPSSLNPDYQTTVLIFRIRGCSPRYQGFDTTISQALVFLVSSGNSQLLYPLPRTLETPLG